MDVQLSVSAPENVPLPAVVISFETADHAVRMKLSAKLSEFNLSVRATNVLRKADVVYLGELIRLQPDTLMRYKNSGRRTVEELAKLVTNQGFEFGTHIPDWSREAATEVYEACSEQRIAEVRRRSDELLNAHGSKPENLEQELQRIAQALEKGRNSEIIIKLWGWGGDEPRTLDSVGKEFNLTRERVRQIESRAFKRLERFQFDTSYLKAVIAALRKGVPNTTSQLQKALQRQKLTSTRFSLASIKQAAEHLNIKWPFASVSRGRLKFIVDKSHYKGFSQIMPAVRRRTSELGYLNILSLATEVGLGDERIETIRVFLNALPEIEWLDNEKQWFFLRDAARNRLVNLCTKVLSVTDTIRLSELRRAVLKCRRLSMAPPLKILGAFIQFSGLGRVEGDVVFSDPERKTTPEPDSTEGKFLQVFNEHGPIMEGEDFADKCIAAGMNPITFYIYRMNSPIVSTLGKGIYCKVGTEVPPGTIESIISHRRTAPRIFDHGWTPGGFLWCGISASRSVIMAGSILLPNFVADLVQGEWHIRLPDGSHYGLVTCKDAFIRSFRKAFVVLGVELDDLVTFEFDLKERTVTVKTGGPGLFEAIQDSQELNTIDAEIADI